MTKTQADLLRRAVKHEASANRNGMDMGWYPVTKPSLRTAIGCSDKRWLRVYSDDLFLLTPAGRAALKEHDAKMKKKGATP